MESPAGLLFRRRRAVECGSHEGAPTGSSETGSGRSRSGLRCLVDSLTLEAPRSLHEWSQVRSGDLLLGNREGVHHGEVVVTVVQALEGLAEQGGTDARVQLVEQAGQVEGGLDARQGLSIKGVDGVAVGPLCCDHPRQLPQQGSVNVPVYDVGSSSAWSSR